MLFGGYIVGYLFLAGAGSGTFLVAACCCVGDALRRTDASERLARAVQPGFYVAPCLMVLAGVLLLLDLGNAERAWLVATMPFQSVMSAGAWLVVLLTVVSGGLAGAGLLMHEAPRPFLWFGCLAGAFLAVGTMGYTGLLLSDMVGVDFWRTPWLVALFVASSLSCGVAVVTVADVLFAPAGADGLSRTGHMSAPALWCTGAVLTIVEAAVLVAFLATQRAFTEPSRASCELLLAGSLAPLFWAGVCGAGIVLPLAAHAARCVLSVAAARLVASAGVLVGGLLLRHCVVAAALFTPLALGAI